MTVRIEDQPGFGHLEVCKPDGSLAFTLPKALLDRPDVLRALLKLSEAGGAKALRSAEQGGRHWVQVPDGSVMETWERKLLTVTKGQSWAVWADEKGLARLCRFDAHLEAWATPIGHMDEEEMAERGWRKVPAPAGWPVGEG